MAKKKPLLSKASGAAARAAALAGADELCKSLAFVAALHVDDKRSEQRIYAAIRTIQLLKQPK